SASPPVRNWSPCLFFWQARPEFSRSLRTSHLAAWPRHNLLLLLSLLGVRHRKRLRRSFSFGICLASRAHLLRYGLDLFLQPFLRHSRLTIGRDRPISEKLVSLIHPFTNSRRTIRDNRTQYWRQALACLAQLFDSFLPL